MKKIVKIITITALLFSSLITLGTITVYTFEDTIKEQRFNHLIKILRCPKCQNNNLADSNSALAIDLKDIIYEQVKAGKTDDEIIFYFE